MKEEGAVPGDIVPFLDELGEGLGDPEMDCVGDPLIFTIFARYV